MDEGRARGGRRFGLVGAVYDAYCLIKLTTHAFFCPVRSRLSRPAAAPALELVDFAVEGTGTASVAEARKWSMVSPSSSSPPPSESSASEALGPVPFPSPRRSGGYHTAQRPQLLSRSAAKRESVMALGSIRHLQYQFAKQGLANKTRCGRPCARGGCPLI